MYKQLNVVLRVQRYGRSDHVKNIFNDSCIVEWVEFQILKWGNIENCDGCVYGIECDDEPTRIKAQYVIDRYSCKQLVGWYAGFTKNSITVAPQEEAHERNYIKENRIRITVKELNAYYSKVKNN